MSAHVIIRVRVAVADERLYGLYDSDNGSPPKLDIAVEGRQREPTQGEREEVLEALLNAASRARRLAYQMLGRKPRAG